MELMVVIGIIALLIAALAFPLSAAREKSRDRKRLADLGQIEFALAAYVQTHGTNIDCVGGLLIDGSNTVVSMPGAYTSASTGNCNDGASILSFMESFLGSIPADPKGPGSDEFYYYFDPAHTCLVGDVDAPLLFAIDLESEGSNVLDVCDDRKDPRGGYMEGSSEPYVQLIDFSEVY